MEREKEQRRRGRRGDPLRKLVRIEHGAVGDDEGRAGEEQRQSKSAAQKPETLRLWRAHGTRERRRGGALSSSAAAASSTISGRLPRRMSHITPRISTMPTQSRSNTP